MRDGVVSKLIFNKSGKYDLEIQDVLPPAVAGAAPLIRLFYYRPAPGRTPAPPPAIF